MRIRSYHWSTLQMSLSARSRERIWTARTALILHFVGQLIVVTGAAAQTDTAFTDDPLVPGVTPVRAVHFREIRTRIDVVRARVRLPAFAWTDGTLTPGITPVRHVHLTDMREALAAAYEAAGRPVPAFGADATGVAAGTPIRASHVTEMRMAVIALEAVLVDALDDRAALVALYEATGGPNWRNNTNWLTDAPMGAALLHRMLSPSFIRGYARGPTLARALWRGTASGQRLHPPLSGLRPA